MCASKNFRLFSGMWVHFPTLENDKKRGRFWGYTGVLVVAPWRLFNVRYSRVHFEHICDRFLHAFYMVGLYIMFCHKYSVRLIYYYYINGFVWRK